MTLAAAGRRRRTAGRGARARRTCQRHARRAGAALAPTEFTSWLLDGAPRRLPAGGSASPTRSPAGSSAARRDTVWSCSTPPIRRSSRSSPRCFTARSRRRGRTAALATRPAPRWPRAAIPRRSCRRPMACRSSASTGDGAASRSESGRQFVAGETAFSADGARRSSRVTRAVQPERAAPSPGAGHALPDHLLRGRTERARVSRPAGRGLPRTSACRCRSSIPAPPPRWSIPPPPDSSRSTTFRSRICSRRTRPR